MALFGSVGGRYAAAAPLAILVAGAAGIYGIGDHGSNPPACSADTALLAAMKPRATGEVAAVVVADAPRELPMLAFQDAAGKERTLADFRGKVVLLNLWATWCVPCRTEMPTLDRLQARFGGKDFEVVAVSLDTRDTEKPKRFLSEIRATALPFYADPSARMFQELRKVGRAVGMPTTLLLDRSGCEIAYLPGPAEWDSPDAVALIEAALGRS